MTKKRDFAPWIDILVMLKEFVIGLGIAFALPGLMILVVVFLAGCPMVTEGIGGAEEEGGTTGLETVAVDARCNLEVPCRFPDEAGSGGGSAGEDDESSSESGSEESGSSEDTSGGSTDESSETGAQSSFDGLYGDCTEACTLSSIDFFDGCLCTVMCTSDEDCANAENLSTTEGSGVCASEWGWCVQPCAAGCPDGTVCQQEDGLELEFCVWP